MEPEISSSQYENRNLNNIYVLSAWDPTSFKTHFYANY